MRGFLLDTSVLAALADPAGPEPVKRFAGAVEEPRLFISALALSDYDRGIAGLADDDPRRARFAFARNAVAARFRDRIVSLDDGVVARAGAILGRVRRDRGRAPTLTAALLAASSIEAGLYLAVSGDLGCEGSGACLFDPWRDDPGAFPLAS